MFITKLLRRNLQTPEVDTSAENAPLPRPESNTHHANERPTKRPFHPKPPAGNQLPKTKSNPGDPVHMDAFSPTTVRSAATHGQNGPPPRLICEADI